MFKKAIYAAMSFGPVLALAQAPDFGNLDAIVDFITRTVRSLIPIFFALAIIYFFWGLIEYIRSAGDAKKAAEGRSIMIYGVIAIAVMISVYGLVVWLQNLFGISDVTSLPIPTVEGL